MAICRRQTYHGQLIGKCNVILSKSDQKSNWTELWETVNLQLSYDQLTWSLIIRKIEKTLGFAQLEPS